MKFLIIIAFTAIIIGIAILYFYCDVLPYWNAPQGFYEVPTVLDKYDLRNICHLGYI